MTKSIAIMLLAAAVVLTLSACGASDSQPAPQSTKPGTASEHTQTPAEPGPSDSAGNDEIVGTDAPDIETTGDAEKTEETSVPELKMKIDGHEIPVIWEDNASVRALLELVSASPVTVGMSMYGGFEQVGSLGTDLPRNDVQTTTQAGDIVLYSGDQIVVFYGSNSWAYTRLGRIDGMSGSALADLLGGGAVELILFAE